ncbi:hypothetical protein MKX03_022859 [Papaver bracteatum]|nr:hypothetical protein MKX03_022859 [Papaver bracteatum]
MATTTNLSQISCFSSMNRKLNLHQRNRFMVTLPVRPSKSSVVMQLERGSVEPSSLDMKTTMTSPAGDSKLQADGSVRSHPTNEEPVDGQLGKDVELQEEEIKEPIKAAKIHDFCFGIPFGGLVLSGGFVGFLFSRNPVTLATGILYGGALLALSMLSLKVWRQGKSSLPLILGQAALSAALLWKHFHNYSLTKKIFPAGFYAIMSAAMLCFYSYVMISGGNPPPKKKVIVVSPSS